MKPKYIFISGGVISGLGKGITTASIALLLKSAGFAVVPVKCENYLNVDAGTINPIEHGDPFLCEDGTEADMDVGTYEKFLSQDMGRSNFITMGQIYKEVIEKERRFEYMGEDVQEVIHITGEIIKRIKHAQELNHAQIAVVELGGTAGEYQNILYYEASRILALQYPGDVIHVHVTYLPTPAHLGEPKTKPAQLSVRMVNSVGIQPDILVARSHEPLDERRRKRLSLFCNVAPQDVFSSWDLGNIYENPIILEGQGLSKRILSKLQLPQRKPKIDNWLKLVERIKKPKEKTVFVTIVGKYFSTGAYQLKDSYAALFDALDHASLAKNVAIKTKWIDAAEVEKKGVGIIGKPDGIIVPIGWGQRGAGGMIATAGYARNKKIPYLGLCYGMQLAAVSFARDIFGWSDADTTENNLKTSHPIIHLVKGQKSLIKKRSYGGTMRLGGWRADVKKDTLTYSLYKKYDKFLENKDGLSSERHRHRWEFNNKYSQAFEKRGFIISARSTSENLVEIVELAQSDHPFYLGTQGHPEYKSRPLKPHPLFLGFIDSCIKQREMVK